jgi:hypothetical protein
MSIGQDLLNVPMGEMIRDMAFAIADGQFQLDQSGMRTAEMMGGLQSVFDDAGNQTFDDSRIFFGYEYMTVRAALAYAIFDDSLTGALDEDSIRLKEVVLDLVRTLAPASASVSDAARQKYLDGTDRSGADTLTGELDKPVPDPDAADPSATRSFLDTVVRIPIRRSMMELGFTPTFYQFVDTIIEVRIAIKMTRTREFSRTTTDTAREASSARRRTRRGGGIAGLFGGRRSRSYAGRSQVQTSQVDATYAGKYSYSAEGASLLRTKLVPVPPPAILEERIRGFMELEDEERRKQLARIAGDDGDLGTDS